MTSGTLILMIESVSPAWLLWNRIDRGMLPAITKIQLIVPKVTVQLAGSRKGQGLLDCR